MFCTMLRNGIAQFVGSWVSESGYHLHIAHYNDYYENFEVDLWEEGKGFILHLDHKYNYALDLEQRDALVPAISRYERDLFLDAFYQLFGPLDHFVRRRSTKAKTIGARLL